MKKTYINPTLEVVKIATQQMLASSINIETKTAGLSEESADEGVDASARGFDWDD